MGLAVLGRTAILLDKALSCHSLAVPGVDAVALGVLSDVLDKELLLTGALLEILRSTQLMPYFVSRFPKVCDKCVKLKFCSLLRESQPEAKVFSLPFSLPFPFPFLPSFLSSF